MRATIGGVACLLALATASCGKPAEKRTDEVRQSIRVVGAGGDAREVTVRSDEGTAVIRTGDADAAMPAGLALYPHAKLTSSVTLKDADPAKSGTVLSFESADKPDAIVDFYKAAAKTAGYALDGAMRSDDMAMIAGKRPGGQFNLTVTRDGATSRATIIAGSE